VVAFDTTVAAFDRATGARTWTTPLAAPRRDVLISYAAPAADAEGNLYGLAWDAYSLDARGAARWQVTTDATVSGGGEVSTLHRPPVVLSPEGLLFVNDGRQQRALRTGDGSEVWRRSDAFVFAGAGPVVVGATEVRSASDGALRGHVRASDGSRLYVWGLAGFGFIGGNGDSGAVEAVDRCDRTLWSLPPDPGWAYGIAGVGPGGVTYVFRSPPTDTTRPSTLFTISAQGAPLASAAANGGSLVAIGADGTAYLQSCLNGDPEIVALGPDLQPLWRLPVEGICAATGLLDDDGVLYMFTLLDGRYRLVAAQTTSPGLSRDGWPSRWHDARATRWLLP
jgi:outer membrane protein assembly factor BamB